MPEYEIPKEVCNTFPNTSQLVKNTPLLVIFATNFSSFRKIWKCGDWSNTRLYLTGHKAERNHKLHKVLKIRGHSCCKKYNQPTAFNVTASTRTPG